MSQRAVVVVYTRAGCVYCSRLMALLAREEITFTHHDLSGDDAGRARLAEASGQGTVPQVFINQVPVGGYTDVEALRRRGELARLLAEAPSS